MFIDSAQTVPHPRAPKTATSIPENAAETPSARPLIRAGFRTRAACTVIKSHELAPDFGEK
jgi:hypothetical protein